MQKSVALVVRRLNDLVQFLVLAEYAEEHFQDAVMRVPAGVCKGDGIGFVPGQDIGVVLDE